MPVQYRTFALKLNKDFLRLWILLHFQTFYYYLIVNHGQKITSLVQLQDQQVDRTLYGTS